MVSAFDVAAYIEGQMGPQGLMKLLKLVYYSQVWSSVWDGEPLFENTVRAWRQGPVVEEVWRRRRNHIELGGDPALLSAAQRETVDAVIEFYGRYSGGRLSELTHREHPWSDANARGNNWTITIEQMVAFYGAVPELRDCEKHLPESYRSGVEMLLSMTEAEVAEFYADMEAGEDVETESAEWLFS